MEGEWAAAKHGGKSKHGWKKLLGTANVSFVRTKKRIGLGKVDMSTDAPMFHDRKRLSRKRSSSSP